MKFSYKLLTSLTILFCGCSGGYRTHVGPTCVSCRPYFCRGEWHYPQNFYEYDEVGLASWYGDDCQGKPKATGEIFNKMHMTAAHKTLPLPTVVKVTNLRNGKSAIVVVDDRGPFHYKGRIIDLSYGVAKTLDLHRFMPSKVRVQSLVGESMKLSLYIASNCKRRKDKYGRSWSQVYAQEIAGFSPKTYNTYENSLNYTPVSYNKNTKQIKKQKAVFIKKPKNEKNQVLRKKSAMKTYLDKNL